MTQPQAPDSTSASTSTTTPTSLSSLLKQPRARGRGWRRATGVVALLLLAGAAYWWWMPGQSKAVRYVTEAVQQGELVVTATATGTVQPTQSVEVSSELSGLIDAVYVDENDQVVEGQLLAQLDTAKLNDAITKSRAGLAAAVAQVLQNEATLLEARLKLKRMEEVHRISKGKVPAATEMEVAQAAVQRAQANLNAAQANVQQVEAELKTNETNLSKAQIRSPVNGVVLVRQVQPGNTVVASMSAPVLFTIAEDLAKMELQVNIDEADVAMIKPDLNATFTVSAWPGRRFQAQIERVGLGSTTTDNVVTYKTIMGVKNPDLALRPGMTATVTVVTAQREQALLVPNAALRFSPQSATPAAAASGPNLVSRLVPRGPSRPRTESRGNAANNKVWILEAGQPKAVDVKTGLTNGRMTEIVGGPLKVGDAVIVSQESVK